MKTTKGQLGVYHLMIVSKFFNDIQDYINLELSTPKAKGNMEKFHMNHIPLDKWSRRFFTSLETLHVYNKTDEHFKDETFHKRVCHYKIQYSEEWAKKKKENEEYKHVRLNFTTSWKLKGIPEGVTRIGKNCFFNYQKISKIIMPNSVTSVENNAFCLLYHLTQIKLSTNLKHISYSSFRDMSQLPQIVFPDSLISFDIGIMDRCSNLTAITIPSHWSQIGDRICNNKPFYCLIQIPSSIKTINGEPVKIVNQKEFNVPSYVTKLNSCCFSCSKYTRITMSSSMINELTADYISQSYQLQEITIPTTVTLMNVRFLQSLGKSYYPSKPLKEEMMIPPHWKQLENIIQISKKDSINWCTIPWTVKEVNEKEIVISKTDVYDIPSYVTELSGSSFAGCSYTKITIPTSIKRLPGNCFYRCHELKEVIIPTSVTEISPYCFCDCWSLTSLTIPTSVVEFGKCCFQNSGISQQDHPNLSFLCFEDPDEVNYDDWDLCD